MKKIYFTLLLIGNCALVKGQTDSVASNFKHEVGLGAGAGLSTLLYKTNADVKAGAGGVFFFDYAYSFRPNWSIVTGVSLSYAQTQAEAKAIKQRTQQTYIFDVPTTLYLESEFENLREKQEALFIHIPVMIRYQSTLEGNTQYYVALGGKIGLNVWNRGRAYADKLITTGNFEDFKQIFKDVITHNFTSTSNVNYENEMPLSNIDFSVAFEAGVKQTITRGTRLYVGLFCEYGIGSLTNKHKEDALVSYEPDDSKIFNYIGLLASSHLDGKKVNLFSAGLKMRFTFCLE